MALLVCGRPPYGAAAPGPPVGPTEANRLGSAFGYSGGGEGGITIMVAPGIPARVAARLAATSAGMPAAEIATGTGEGNAALGATRRRRCGRRCWGRFVRRHHGCRGRFVPRGGHRRSARGGSAPGSKTRHGGPDHTRQRHAGVGAVSGGLAVLHDYRDGGAWQRRGDLTHCQRGGPGLRHREPTDRASPAGKCGHRRATPKPGHEPSRRRIGLPYSNQFHRRTGFAAMLIRQPHCPLAQDGTRDSQRCEGNKVQTNEDPITY